MSVEMTLESLHIHGHQRSDVTELSNMLDTSTEIVGRIVDGKFVMKVGKNPNIFSDKSPKVILLEKELEEAQTEHIAAMKGLVLVAFRNEVRDFTEKYEEPPTRCLMNYRDIHTLVDAYNEERSVNDIPRDRVSYLDSTIVIDGITIKNGCDQNPGEYRFYSFE